MNRIISVLAGALVVTAVAGLSACSSSGSGANSGASNEPAGATGSSPLSGTVTVLAASSLLGTFTQLGKQFEAAHPGTTVKFDFGGSSDLATQITQGDRADVFAAASTKTMDQVVSDGDATGPQNFATNTMEIATPPGNPAKITSLADLARSGLKVAVCDPAVPCGVVAAEVLQNASVTLTPTAREQDVKSTLTVVESGEVDAGIVYVTDVKAAGGKVTGVPIPAAVNATTTYPIVALKHAPNSAVAKAFVAYVLSEAGQQVLRAAAFAPAP